MPIPAVMTLKEATLMLSPHSPAVDLRRCLNSFKVWQYNSSELVFNFSAMQKLKYIVDPLFCNQAHELNIFSTLPKLEEVRLLGLKGNVSFAATPNLSKESILYMVQNAAPTATITITLHATAYTMAKADAEITAALSRNNLVRLASA